MFVAESSGGVWGLSLGARRLQCALLLGLVSGLLFPSSAVADYRTSLRWRVAAAGLTSERGIDGVTTPSLGQRSTHQIKGGELQTFQFAAAAGQYVRVTVRQLRIILQVTL